MADPNSDSVLDAAVLDSLRELGGEDDPSLFLEVLELYLDDATTHVGNLRAALDARDLLLLERTAHTLKSSSANVGAMRLSKLCFELEQRVRAAQIDAVPPLVDEAERHFGAVRSALRAAMG